jgi:two-component system chemotaxis response regulator CheY
MKVLIIDDSRAMRRLLSSCMKPFSAETIEAEDGRQALEKLLLGAPFDLALVDWDMPVMNGLDFVKAVRSEQVYSEMKILMITAQNGMDRVCEALESGADDFLMKPMTEGMLVDKLRMMGLAA